MGAPLDLSVTSSDVAELIAYQPLGQFHLTLMLRHASGQGKVQAIANWAGQPLLMASDPRHSSVALALLPPRTSQPVHGPHSLPLRETFAALADAVSLYAPLPLAQQLQEAQQGFEIIGQERIFARILPKAGPMPASLLTQQAEADKEILLQSMSRHWYQQTKVLLPAERLRAHCDGGDILCAFNEVGTLSGFQLITRLPGGHVLLGPLCADAPGRAALYQQQDLLGSTKQTQLPAFIFAAVSEEDTAQQSSLRTHGFYPLDHYRFASLLRCQP